MTLAFQPRRLRGSHARVGRLLITSFVIVSALAGAVFAQTTNSIAGSVSDESGGAIVSATVSLENEAGRSIATAVTDARGVFTFKVAAAVGYQLRVEKAQFSSVRVALT